MFHCLQIMHYLPKVFIVNVVFQRKGNYFRNENIQLVPVNSLKSTLQWHLEGKALKINNQNVHFKSMLKGAGSTGLPGWTAIWSPGAAHECGALWHHSWHSFLLSHTTFQLLLHKSHISSFTCLSHFPLLQKRCNYLMIFRNGSTFGFDVTSATKNVLTQKSGFVFFFPGRHFLFLVSWNTLLSLLESNGRPQGDLEVASLWEPGLAWQIWLWDQPGGCAHSRIICSGPSSTHQPFLCVAN